MDVFYVISARNVHSPSTIAVDRHAVVPATPARYQAGSLLLLTLPIPFFLHMLSMVKPKRKYPTYSKKYPGLF